MKSISRYWNDNVRTLTNVKILWSDSLVNSIRGFRPGVPDIGWSDSLVDSVMGFEPGVPGSIPSSGKNFAFRATLVGFR